MCLAVLEPLCSLYACVLLETFRGLLAQLVCTTHNKHK